MTELDDLIPIQPAEVDDLADFTPPLTRNGLLLYCLSGLISGGVVVWLVELFR